MAGIDHCAIISDETFNFATPADRFDVLVTHQQRAVFENGKLAQIAARARPANTRKRYKL
jgi:hypothetical protein